MVDYGLPWWFWFGFVAGFGFVCLWRSVYVCCWCLWPVACWLGFRGFGLIAVGLFVCGFGGFDGCLLVLG